GLPGTPGTPDAQYSLPEPVNGMSVTVVKRDEQPTPGGWMLYTIRSITWLEEDPKDEEHKKGEIIAEVEWMSAGVGGNATAGKWLHESPIVTALSILDKHTIIFTHQLSGEAGN
ncbi:MAG: hypothetical protein COT13_00390, partial [Chloroflexi bacterium CG08_land_8_20_14_0_20_45_12]